jgi:hypothetical protein
MVALALDGIGGVLAFGTGDVKDAHPGSVVASIIG